MARRRTGAFTRRGYTRALRVPSVVSMPGIWKMPGPARRMRALRSARLPACGFWWLPATTALRHLRARLFAQLGLEDLAGRIAGQRGDEHHLPGHFVVRQFIAHEFQQRRFV